MNAGATEENGNWHGKIPSDWRVQKLKRVFSGIDYGISESTSDEGSFPVLKMGNIVAGEIAFTNIEFVHDVDATLLLRPNDLLFNRTNSLDQVAKVGIFRGHSESDVTFASYLVRLRTSPRNHPNYINYVLNDDGFIGLARKLAIPSVQQANLNPTRYGRLEVPLPPLPEQERIAAYLDASCAAIDRAVETKQEQLETLDALLKSIIQRAITQGLDPKVKMKDSGVGWLGPIPTHWGVRRIKDIVDARSGNGITSHDIAPECEYPVYGGNGLRGYTDTYTHEGLFVLIGRQGALCGNINYASGKFYASEHAVVCTPYHEIQTYWFGALLDTMNLNQYSNAAAQPGLSVARIKRLQIPIPPASERLKIEQYLSETSKSIEKISSNISEQISTLSSYRKSLIHECVTGRRRISETDAAKVKAHV